VSAAVVPVALV